MNENLLKFELLDLSELTIGFALAAHDGCGGSNGQCKDGCGCGGDNGHCGTSSGTN